MNKILRFGISILAPFVAGGIGSFFTTPAIPTWYASPSKTLIQSTK